jgi:hypothetical protein
MIGDDVVKDGINLSGVYVRRRVRPNGDTYHTVEIDIDDLRRIIQPIVARFNKARKYWVLKIDRHEYRR